MGSTATTVTVSKSKSKVGGSSKKGRQHAVHIKKYLKQADRTSKNKNRAWKKHLSNHPKDLVAKKDLERLMGKF
jgi:hypothetical protein